MINLFHNNEYGFEGSYIGQSNGTVESNVFVAHLMELENPQDNEVDITQIRANSCSNQKGFRHSSPGLGSITEFYVLSSKKTSSRRNVRSETEERNLQRRNDWTNQMIKCLENVSLNKVTLKQYQEVYATLGVVPFQSSIDASVRIEDQNNQDTFHTAVYKRLKLISSSYHIPI